jgi:hypothetical protein
MCYERGDDHGCPEALCRVMRVEMPIDQFLVGLHEMNVSCSNSNNFVKNFCLRLLMRELCRLIPSNSPLVFQYGSGPSPDFLAKILDVDTSPFS